MQENNSELTAIINKGFLNSITTDSTFNILSISPQFCNILNTPIDELLNQNIASIFSSNESSYSNEASWLKACRNNWSLVFFSKEEIYFECFCIATTHTEKEAWQFLIKVLDINKISDALQLLPVAIVDHTQEMAQLGNWSWDLITNKIKWSKQVFRSFGLPVSNVSPSMEQYMSLIHPEDLENQITHKATMLQNGAPYREEVRLKQPDNSYKWSLVYSYPILKDGKVVAVEGTNLDIHEKKMNELQLKESLEIQTQLLEENKLKEQKISSLINNTKDLMWAVNLEYEIIVINDSFINNIKQMLGLNISQGMNILKVFTPDIAQTWKTKYDRTFMGEVWMDEFDGGAYCIENYFNPIKDANGIVIGAAVFSREITARKQAQKTIEAALQQELRLNEELATREEELRQNIEYQNQLINVISERENLIRSLNNNLAGGFVYQKTIVDGKDVYFKHCSQGIEHILGIELQDLLENAQAFTRRIVSQDAALVTEINNKSIIKPGVYEYEARYYNINNEPIWLYERFVSKQNAFGEVECFGIVLDVNDRKSLESENKSFQELIKSIVNNVPVLLWATNKDGKLTFIDGATKEMLNVNTNQLLGENILDVFHTDNNDHQKYFSQCVAQQEDFSILIPIPTAYIDFRATRQNNDAGEFVGFIGVGIDVSESIKSENKIKDFIAEQTALIERVSRNEASLAAVFNSTSDIIVSVNKDLKITEFNQSYAYMIKASMGLIVEKGGDLQKFTGEGFWPTTVACIDRVLKGEIVSDVMVYTPSEGSSIYLSVIYAPIYTEQKQVIGITIIARDITQAKQLEQKVVEVNKQVAEYRLMALRSVMNPHFLFNALNSIQYFISKNNRELASNYLSLFSKLIRKVLESSVSNNISLNSELEILNHYLDLEILRFENKFSYQIDIDSELQEEDGIEIPSLLIQPYVENAILHGLTNKIGAGKLLIKLQLTPDDQLLVVIEDNGIGRQEAQKIKDASLIKQKSYGMGVTQERLDIINKTNKVNVTITDLIEDGIATGTRVEIYIGIV